jgi:hypothetical protein
MNTFTPEHGVSELFTASESAMRETPFKDLLKALEAQKTASTPTSFSPSLPLLDEERR